MADEQIAAQQARLTQEKTQRYALNGGSLALLSVALIIIRGQIIKRKKEKQIYHVNQLLAKEKLIANKKELEYNKQQLNTFINNIVKKNIIIQKLKRELENISSKEVMRTSQIQDLMEMKILTNEDWSDFMRTTTDMEFPPATSSSS